jgi:hypothetical protein
MSRKTLIGYAVGGLALAASSGAIAAPVALNDTYWGGDPNGGGGVEVIGGPAYAISGLTAERVGDDLNVTISTNYVNNIGAGGTQIGALFIGDPNKLQYNGADGSAAHTDDVFTADSDRFSYAFDFDVANTAVSAGQANKNGSLYALDGSFANNSSADVRLSGIRRRVGRH